MHLYHGNPVTISGLLSVTTLLRWRTYFVTRKASSISVAFVKVTGSDGHLDFLSCASCNANPTLGVFLVSHKRIRKQDHII